MSKTDTKPASALDGDAHAQSAEALGQLAGGMALDLNDFLTAILAHLDLLEAGLESDDRERVGHDLREIRRTATTGARMVKHLLSISRGDRLRLQPVSLEEVVRDAIGRIRPLIPEGMEVVSELGVVDPVLADRAAVEQILTTLATNARDTMSPGGTLSFTVAPGGFDRDHRVRTGWGDPDDFGVITVRDDGRGMSPEAVAALFRPFSDRLDGDGPRLSMAVVYGLMKQHRGFIEVESEPDSGTTVRLYFRTFQRDSLPIAEESSEEEAEGTGGAARATILFVEDDESLRSVSCRILRSQGYRVLEAGNGSEALEVMDREGAPDVLIVDLIMPGMTGVELLERLEKESRLPRVLLTSGFGPNFLLGWEGVEPSSHPFLEKPWQIENLLEQVRNVLDR